eukprot:366278-Chlamydomonas_euryale.AAC.53
MGRGQHGQQPKQLHGAHDERRHHEPLEAEPREGRRQRWDNVGKRGSAQANDGSDDTAEETCIVGGHGAMRPPWLAA